MGNTSTNSSVPKVQRALVLSGGGALGAYQAGAIMSLYEKFRNSGNNDESFFDIIIGTSSGAINGAILVSHFLENKSWQGVGEKLESFWKYLSTPTPDIGEASKKWKEEYQKENPSVASEEAARRYYSVSEFSKRGIENVFMPKYPPKEDEKFFDIQNKWLLYDNQPLRKSIEKFARFPIATSFDNGEPRLLVVSVDVEEGTTVTFDSYEKDIGKRRTVYGHHLGEKPITLEYDEGVGIKHIMASSTLPEVYAYEEIGRRKLWDGGILSNSPIRELLEAHRSFWESRIGAENLENPFRDSKIANTETNTGLQQGNHRVPDLEIYVVSLWNPSVSHTKDGYGVPQDIDGVRNRHSDIKLGNDYYAIDDFTLYSDYVNLIERLISLGNDNAELKDKINSILDENTPRRYFTETYRKNIDILKNSFKVVKVVYLRRKDDRASISGKIGDFTAETIDKLIEEGYQETMSK